MLMLTTFLRCVYSACFLMLITTSEGLAEWQTLICGVVAAVAAAIVTIIVAIKGKKK